MAADKSINYYTNLTVPPRKQPLQPSLWQRCFPSTDTKPAPIAQQRARIACRLQQEPPTAQPSRVDTVQFDQQPRCQYAPALVAAIKQQPSKQRWPPPPATLLAALSSCRLTVVTSYLFSILLAVAIHGLALGSIKWKL